MSRIIIAALLVIALTLSVVTLPALLGIDNASANDNPEPTTWGKVKQMFVSAALGWVKIMIDWGNPRSS